MSAGGEEDSIIEVFRNVCRRALHSGLGESAGEAVLFFLHRGLGRDPFNALWEDPKSVYYEMEKIFGVGAKILINLLIAGVNKEYGLNMNHERLLELMRCGDQMSIEEIRSFMRKIAEAHKYRGGE
ncbi:MAG: hypothetical protein N3E47_01995 [Candidatus Bathyarchaeota archaeon]|nr:hypothetical protein [Candidatus Bathyarchaeota archaeon]